MVSGISLVVPLQNEEASVGRLLRSVAALSRLPEEIVIVDAGSTDRTAERVVECAGGLPVQLVRTGPLFPGLARNLGVARARHEWLAFTDGGIELAPGWLEALAAKALPGVGAVVGAFEPVADTPFRRCAALAYVPARLADGTRGPFVASSLVRRSAFERAGGFPPFRAAEDLVFFERLRETGAVVVPAASAVVRWQIAGSPRATFRRFALYSRHNLVARRQRHWHYGVARLYLALAPACLGAALIAGAGAALPVVAAFFLARAARAAWRKRDTLPFSTLNPLRIAGAAGVLLLIDLATLAGFVSWVAGGRQRST